VSDTFYEILITGNELILISGFYMDLRFFLNNQILQLKECKATSVSTRRNIYSHFEFLGNGKANEVTLPFSNLRKGKALLNKYNFSE
jgi:hypothetical protein